MKNQKMIDQISAIMLVIGGICMGLVGAFDFEPISALFNSVGMDGSVMMSPLTRIIYVLIGLSAVYKVVLWAKNRK